MTVQIITSPSGDELVVLERREYDRLVAAASATDTDVQDRADEVQAGAMIDRISSGAEEVLTLEEADALAAAKTPLAFWRRKRAATQAELAADLGVRQGYVSDLESGRRTGTVSTYAKLARALRVDISDLLTESEPPR